MPRLLDRFSRRRKGQRKQSTRRIERIRRRTRRSLTFAHLEARRLLASSTIEIHAAGNENAEIMELWIAGTLAQTWSNIGGNAYGDVFETYTYTSPTTVIADDVQVHFTNDVYINDGEVDNNLRVDKIVIDGTTYETEDPSVFSTGTLAFAPGFFEDDLLVTDGYFQYAGGANPGNIALGTGDVSVAENGTQVTLQVLRTGGSAGQVTVNYATAPETATAGSDYTAVNGVLTFPDGVTSQTITVPILDDILDEPNETFGVTISSPTGGATLQSPTTANVTINDDDLPPSNGTLALATNAIAVDEANSQVTLQVLRTDGSAGQVTVNYATAPGTATAGADYTAVNGVLTFPDGVTSQTITVPILDDSLDEPNETFGVTISSPTGGATLQSPTTANVTINDDDLPPSNGTLALATNAIAVDEANSQVTLQVLRTDGSAGQVTVNYATAPGTATAGADYTAVNGVLTFPDGVTSQTITIPILDDILDEPNETFGVTISSPTGGATLQSPTTANVTINDDDLPPSNGTLALATNAIAVDEANSQVTLQVLRTDGSAGQVTVNYATAPGTATAGADYTAVNGVLTFPDGVTSQTITVPILDDILDEPNETFGVTISSPTGGATLQSPTTANVTINDDDLPPSNGTLALATNAIAVDEANSQVTLQVLRTDGSAGQVTVNYATAPGTATAGADYTAVNGVLTFPDGVTSQTITIPILDDTLDEPNETFGVTISSPTGGATLQSPTTANVTINDDDLPPSNGTLALATNAIAVDEANSQVTLQVLRTDGSAGQVTVNYATAPGTATAGADYTAVNGVLTFPDGVTSQTITIPILDDILDEPNETFGVTISSPTGGATLQSPTTANVTINDDDLPPSNGTLALATNAIAVDEANSQVTLQVLRTDGSAGQVTVNYATAPGTATAGADYTAVNGVLTFPDGVTSQTITVPILDDILDEPNETFGVTISSPTGGATLQSPTTANVTINDDDLPPSNGTLALATNAIAVDEANSQVTLQVLRTDGSAGQVTVNYATAPGTATAGADYTAVNGVLTFPDGVTSQTITIPILDDSLDEPNETFGVTIGSPTGGATLQSPTTANVTINDDDLPGSGGSTIEIHAAGNENAETMELWIAGSLVQTFTNIGGNAYGGVYVVYSYESPTPVIADDVQVHFTNDVYINNGQIDNNLAVEKIVIDGTSYETEDPSVFSTGTLAFAAGFFEDELLVTNGYFQYAGGANNGVIALETSIVTVGESTPQATLQVLRTGGSAGQVTVDYATQPISATPGVDYTAVTGTLTFEAGETVKSILVPILDDALTEANEQFNITIDNVNGGATLLVPRTATVTVIDDETTLPSYSDFSSIAGLTLNGDASQSGASLDLTAPLPFESGSSFFNTALSLAGNASFRSSFSFQFTGGTLGADGLTFTVQNDPAGPAALGGAGSALGYSGISNSIAVEFDSFQNPGFDISDNHVSIIQGTEQNSLRTANSSFDLNDGNRYYAWVDYNGVSDVLAVYLGTTATKPTLALTKTTVDLEAIVGSQGYFGFTAATGGQTNTHRIRNWQLDQQVPPQDPPIEGTDTVVAVDVISSGLAQPISLDWLPGGSMLIAQKDGIVRTATNGALNPAPFIDISPIVNNIYDRGLLDITVHPDFPATPYVYLLFTYDPPEVFNQPSHPFAGIDGEGNRAGRLIRVTANSATGYLTAVPGSEVVLAGTNSTWNNFNAFANSTQDFSEPPAGELPGGVYVQDFIPTDSESHTVGSLAFGIDGALFVSIGDGASFNQVDVRADRVQDVDSLSGKVLRIDPISGQGLSDNPFFDGNLDSNASKVYQLGLRNPFRISVDSNSGQLYIGDVGWGQWEEINAGGPGANFGWPWYEGGSGTSNIQGAYEETPEGQAFFAQNIPVDASLYALNHQSDGINAIVLGDVYRGSLYGSEYQGDIFFNDLGQGIVRHASIDAQGAVSSVNTFTTGHAVVVDIKEGPDGALYYVDLDDGVIGRWEIVSTNQSSALVEGGQLAAASIGLPPTEPELRMDVTGDQSVTALDALRVVNELGRRSNVGGESAQPPWREQTDVNGDGRTTALDALVIINHLGSTNVPIAPPQTVNAQLTDDDEPDDQPISTIDLVLTELGSD